MIKRRMRMSGVTMLCVTLLLAVACEVAISGRNDAKTVQPMAKDLEFAFSGQVLGTVLSGSRSKENFPYDGIRDDIRAISSWVLKHHNIEQSFDPIGVHLVLIGEFDSDSEEQLTELKIVQNKQKQRNCLLAWHRHKQMSSDIIFDVVCICALRGESPRIVNVSRSFKYVDKTWQEINHRLK